MESCLKSCFNDNISVKTPYMANYAPYSIKNVNFGKESNINVLMFQQSKKYNGILVVYYGFYGFFLILFYYIYYTYGFKWDYDGFVLICLKNNEQSIKQSGGFLNG